MSEIWNEEAETYNSDMPEVEEVAPGQWVDRTPVPPVAGGGGRRPRSTGVPPAPAQRPARPAAQPAEPYRTADELGYDADAINSTEEDDFTEVLSDATLRLEQGNLYKLVMNNDLFQGADADPRAVANVQREIRRFARERMEIMLGMRQEKQVQDYARYSAELAAQANPFNGLEVQILKQVAAAASKGATERPEAEEIAVQIQKKTTLSPIAVPKAKGAVAPAPAPRPVGQGRPDLGPPKPLQARPKAPLKRGPKVNLHEIEATRGLDDATAEAVVDQVMDGDGVDVTTMDEDQLKAHNAKADARRRPRAKNPQAAPLPTVEMANYHHTMNAQQMDPKMQTTIAMLMGKMATKK